VTLSAKQ